MQTNTYNQRVMAGTLTAWLIAFTLISAQVFAAGTWTALAHHAPGPVGLMLLLSDGTVMVEENNDYDTYGPAWYRLTPDSTGSYANGTWSTLAAMSYTRLFFPSQVLRDGRVFVAGGEFGTGQNTAETYNPLTGAWTLAPPTPFGLGDANSEILPDGKVLVAAADWSGHTAIFDPVANTWTAGPATHGAQNESAWVKLPDNSILVVDRDSINAERYIPSLSQWVTDNPVPVQLWYGSEMGAGILLPNGKVIYFGGSGHTAIYTPSGNTGPGSWVLGPDIPDGLGTPDAPCAMMPNGRILCAVTDLPANSKTSFYEYDYSTNSFTQVNAPAGGLTEDGPSYTRNMLVLPDGSVLSSRFSNQLYTYTPFGAPVAAGKPTIGSITPSADGSYNLAGIGLNGISEGAAYGDDWQMASNYPIVRLTSGANVYYARTYNWSSTGVMTGTTPVTTRFALPVSLPLGTYSLVVVANGISSNPFTFSSNTWLDFNSTVLPEYGGYTNPYSTLHHAVNGAPSGGSGVPNGATIYMKGPASSAETITITRPMTLTSVGGAVTIGH